MSKKSYLALVLFCWMAIGALNQEFFGFHAISPGIDNSQNFGYNTGTALTFAAAIWFLFKLGYHLVTKKNRGTKIDSQISASHKSPWRSIAGFLALFTVFFFGGTLLTTAYVNRYQQDLEKVFMMP